MASELTRLDILQILLTEGEESGLVDYSITELLAEVEEEMKNHKSLHQSIDSDLYL